MGPDRGKQNQFWWGRGDALSYIGLLYSVKWFFVYTGLSPWMIQVCIHKNYNRSRTKDGNLRCLLGHMNEWKGQVRECILLTFWFLSIPNCSFLYTDCDNNIKGHVQMSFKPPTSLSFICLESGTWFPSVLATRNRHMIECWASGTQAEIRRGLSFAHFILSAWNMQNALSQCFWVLYYLQLNIFFIIFYIIMKH